MALVALVATILAVYSPFERTASAALGHVQAQTSTELNENCVISILNRTTRIKPDGSWRIDNIPANLGRVRARVTCIEDGVVRSGQSDFFTIESNVVNGFNSEIALGVVDPIPESIAITAPTTTMNTAGQTLQLTVTATLPDGTTTDITRRSLGTNYTISNSNIATVSPDGLVTAGSSGTVLVSAMFEGALGVIRLRRHFGPRVTHQPDRSRAQQQPDQRHFGPRVTHQPDRSLAHPKPDQ